MTLYYVLDSYLDYLLSQVASNDVCHWRRLFFHGSTYYYIKNSTFYVARLKKTDLHTEVSTLAVQVVP